MQAANAELAVSQVTTPEQARLASAAAVPALLVRAAALSPDEISAICLSACRCLDEARAVMAVAVVQLQPWRCRADAPDGGMSAPAANPASVDGVSDSCGIRALRGVLPAAVVCPPDLRSMSGLGTPVGASAAFTAPAWALPVPQAGAAQRLPPETLTALGLVCRSAMHHARVLALVRLEHDIAPYHQRVLTRLSDVSGFLTGTNVASCSPEPDDVAIATDNQRSVTITTSDLVLRRSLLATYPSTSIPELLDSLTRALSNIAALPLASNGTVTLAHRELAAFVLFHLCAAADGSVSLMVSQRLASASHTPPSFSPALARSHVRSETAGPRDPRLASIPQLPRDLVASPSSRAALMRSRAASMPPASPSAQVDFHALAGPASDFAASGAQRLGATPAVLAVIRARTAFLSRNPHRATSGAAVPASANPASHALASIPGGSLAATARLRSQTAPLSFTTPSQGLRGALTAQGAFADPDTDDEVSLAFIEERGRFRLFAGAPRSCRVITETSGLLECIGIGASML
jgi:hypothetical protein